MLVAMQAHEMAVLSDKNPTLTERTRQQLAIGDPKEPSFGHGQHVDATKPECLGHRIGDVFV